MFSKLPWAALAKTHSCCLSLSKPASLQSTFSWFYVQARVEDVSRLRDSSLVCVRFNCIRSRHGRGLALKAGDVLLIAHKNGAASTWGKISQEVQRKDSHRDTQHDLGTLHGAVIGIVMKKISHDCLIKVRLKAN